MARDFAKGFYRSKEWQHCRTAYYKKQGGLCELCLAKGIYKAGEIVHHKIHLNKDNIKDPTVALNFENLQLVCRDCHGKLHGKKKNYKIDEFGRVFVD